MIGFLLSLMLLAHAGTVAAQNNSVALPARAAMPSSQTATQNPNVIMNLVRELLLERTASWPGQANITVHASRQMNQPACDQLEAFLAGTGGLQPRTSVGVRCISPQPWTIYVQASVQIIGTYFVANRLIQKGEALSLDDLDTREGDLLRHRRVISDPSHIIDWIATRRIRAGGNIESNALRAPDSIVRGQQVRTIARGIGFVVMGEAQALGSGSPGSQIQVRTQGGQTITGTVIDSHTVQVMM